MEQYQQAPPVQNGTPANGTPVNGTSATGTQPHQQPAQPQNAQQQGGPVVQGNPPMEHLIQSTALEHGGEQAIVHDMHGWEGDPDEQQFMQLLNEENPNAPQNNNGLQPSPQTPQQGTPGPQAPNGYPAQGFPQQQMPGQQTVYPGQQGYPTYGQPAAPDTRGNVTPVVYNAQTSQQQVDPATGQPLQRARVRSHASMRRVRNCTKGTQRSHTIEDRHMKRSQYKNENRMRVSDLPDARPGMDVQILTDIRCSGGHEMHGIKTKLIVSHHPSGYFIACPECGAELRLLRSEFDLRKTVKPKARRTKMKSF